MGHHVVLVSSGAVGFGLRRLELSKKPKHVPQLQAVAAVGQGRLMALYDSLFTQFHVPIAQILLTRDNLADRAQYLNACNTFKELLNMKVVPIVNENDTVSHAEIRFGDNDSLSAIAAGMVNADYLFLLTDVDCLYTDNPRQNPNAKPIKIVRDMTSLRQQVNVLSSGSSLGTGGMQTKLIAAELASSAGCSTIITLGSKPQQMIQILNEIILKKDEEDFEPTIGTWFMAQNRTLEDRKWWILHGLTFMGIIYIDAGAVKAVISKGSLFAAGIVDVKGTFGSQQCVQIMYQTKGPPKEIARGIVNYTTQEIQSIKGCKSTEIECILGYCESEEVIHRNNLAILVNDSLDDVE